jgi:hypothetical protein
MNRLLRIVGFAFHALLLRPGHLLVIRILEQTV